jgi:hypothetical protein
MLILYTSQNLLKSRYECAYGMFLFSRSQSFPENKCYRPSKSDTSS